MKTLVACRACGYPSLEPYCDLGEQPLANAFLTKEELKKPEAKYPLVLAHCPRCFLSQLTVAVNPETLYREYHYASGHSPQWVQHCHDLVRSVTLKKRIAVEIASNDGTLLKMLHEQGATAIGVEPATNLTRKYRADLKYLPEFFTEKTARWIKTRYGKADVIVAQNVIGHVDDIRGFLYAIKILLNPQRGFAVLEAPYLYAMLQRMEYPQVYHEHLSYWSLLPLQRLAEEVGLMVKMVRPFPHIHGGTMRYYLQTVEKKATYRSVNTRGMKVTRDIGKADPSVPRLMRHELEMQGMPGVPHAFDPTDRIQALQEELERYRGLTVWGYGATAKSTVLMNAISNANVVEAIVDDYPGKQGLYQPGTHIPIVEPMNMKDVYAMLVTAWNWGDAVKQRAETLGFKGTILNPFAA